MDTPIARLARRFALGKERDCFVCGEPMGVTKELTCSEPCELEWSSRMAY